MKESSATKVEKLWQPTHRHAAHTEARNTRAVYACVHARTLARTIRKRKCPSGAERARSELTKSVELIVETGTSVRNTTRTPADAARGCNTTHYAL